MIRDNRRFSTLDCVGGLDLESPPLKLSAGAMIICHNFDVKAGGGYRRIGGFERFDGQPSPSGSDDAQAARDLIGYPVDAVKPVALRYFNGTLYAFFETNVPDVKLYKSSAAGWELVATPSLVTGGRYEIIEHNFYGATSMKRMYGVDGANNAFMFDGTTYTEIVPAGQTDKPRHIAAHKNHLFMSYAQGQYVHSGIGEPTAWDVATEGAGAGGTGDEIVGIRPTVGGALAFFMRNRVNVLYGSSKTDWQANDLRKQQDDAGAIEGSIQDLGDLFYLDDRGLTTLQQTQAFGNFDTSTIDRPVKRFIQNRKRRLISTTISRDRNQYWMLFSAGNSTEVLTLTLGDRGLDGYGRYLLPFKAVCVTSQEDENGDERIFVGAEDGYVYEMEKGSSFDGAPIEAYCKLAFAHFGSPSRTKQFRHLVLGVEANSNVSLRIKPEFDYGSIERAGHRVIDSDLTGGGGQWDDDNWNEFTWSAQIISEAKCDITGTGRNMALLIYYKGDEAESFTLYDATIQYSMRGLRR